MFISVYLCKRRWFICILALTKAMRSTLPEEVQVAKKLDLQLQIDIFSISKCAMIEKINSILQQKIWATVI